MNKLKKKMNSFRINLEFRINLLLIKINLKLNVLFFLKSFAYNYFL